ncbi:MAG: hypothetical protein ACK5F7_04365, partial [Planctomycetaceae bacterium]
HGSSGRGRHVSPGWRWHANVPSRPVEYGAPRWWRNTDEPPRRLRDAAASGRDESRSDESSLNADHTSGTRKYAFDEPSQHGRGQSSGRWDAGSRTGKPSRYGRRQYRGGESAHKLAR